MAKKAYMLAFRGQGIENTNQDVMLQLCKTLVRPHLEYCLQFRLLPYRKDVESLECAEVASQNVTCFTEY